MRLTYDDVSAVPTLPSPPDEAFGLCLRLKPQRADLWLDGRWTPKGSGTGETSVYDLQCEIILHFNDPFDFLFLYLNRRTLLDLADQVGAGPVDFNVAPGKTVADPVMAHLGGCLLPALDAPGDAKDLFLGYIAMAVQIHFLRNYLGRSRRPRCCRSGLTARQFRIARQMMQAELGGNVPLSAVAQECGLSTTHFARAFAISAGQPPHQWLLEQRVAFACRLLGGTKLSIGEVAVRCGFSDQSHFTRVFSARTGLSPGRWRRARQL